MLKAHAKTEVDAMIELSMKLRQGRPENIQAMMQDFETFASQYHQFIQDNPPTNLARFANKLERSITAIQHEWATISRACEQRGLDIFQEMLGEADKKIEGYYSNFRGFKLDVLPIAYFEKVYAIRHFVFTPYPLISIPLRYFNDTTKWSALAHEMGHYIFWNSLGPLNYKRHQTELCKLVIQCLVDNFPDEIPEKDQVQIYLVNTWAAWLEETFADICGALFDGLAYIESTIERAKGETGMDVLQLANDDHDHPMHGLRPLIAIETLNWVANRQGKSNKTSAYKKAIAGLRNEWMTLIEGIFPDKVEYLSESLPAAQVQNALKALLQSVQPVVEVILEGYKGTPSWMQPATDKGDYTNQYALEPASLGDLINHCFGYDDQNVEVSPNLATQRSQLLGTMPHTFEFVKSSLQKDENDDPEMLVNRLLELSLSRQDNQTSVSVRIVVRDEIRNGVQYFVEAGGSPMLTVPAGIWSRVTGLAMFRQV